MMNQIQVAKHKIRIHSPTIRYTYEIQNGFGRKKQQEKCGILGLGKWWALLKIVRITVKIALVQCYSIKCSKKIR